MFIDARSDNEIILLNRIDAREKIYIFQMTSHDYESRLNRIESHGMDLNFSSVYHRMHRIKMYSTVHI